MPSGNRTLVIVSAWCCLLLGASAITAADSLNTLLARLEKVGPQNAGQGGAVSAWEQLNKQPPAAIPQILAALDDASPLAANWIRSAVDAIAENALTEKQKLPLDELTAFVSDRKHSPRARRLAFELIVKSDPNVVVPMYADMIDDPSLELRRDAVARVLDDAEKQLSTNQKENAATAFERALKYARDEDQIKRASDKLKSLGQTVDLPRHFGFLMQWKLIGPFDNVGEKGFNVAYEPEKSLDFTAELPGKAGTLKWQDHTTTDEYGAVDLNAALGKEMSAIAYAAAEFNAGEARPVDLRLASGNASKIWLNGKLLYEAEVYHANVKLDQYIAKGELKPGKNVILLKLCQNEQTEDWAQDWKFQLRVCDETGTAVLSADRKGEATREGK